jgi:hypothetical protein
MTGGDSESRSQYLALALDARKVLDVLIAFLETGQSTEQLNASVEDAIHALESVARPGIVTTGGVHSHLAFDDYEQAKTLDEIRTEDERRKIIEDLQGIGAGTSPGERQAAALRVLEFFFAVESRALQYYTEPPSFAAFAT